MPNARRTALVTKDSKKRVRMIDVARQAQVSQTTVSLVLNNIGGVRIAEATRQLVIETARRLGYSPGPMLHDLQDDHLPIIGVLINEISAAYPIDIIDGLHMAARSAATQLAIFVTDGVVEREAEALTSLRRHPSDALQGFAHVYVNCFRNDGQGVAVIPGERAAGFAAAQYLIGTGCTRLATITGDSWHSSTQRRLSGFRRGMTVAGQSLDATRIKHRDWRHESGRAAMLELLALDERPDGVFCQNDMLARGALAAVAEVGLSVPGDIAILGFDDREFAKDIGLSTMLLPHAAMAERGMRLLAQRDRLDAPVSIRCPLVPRQTTR